jgi:AhpD family alkylhydroperoxidase
MRTILSEDHKELVAIGAAVAANCEPCLAHHIKKARETGLTNEQLQSAVAIARQVKEMPSRLILEAADRLLTSSDLTAPVSSKTGCCG